MLAIVVAYCLFDVDISPPKRRIWSLEEEDLRKLEEFKECLKEELLLQLSSQSSRILLPLSGLLR